MCERGGGETEGFTVKIGSFIEAQSSNPYLFAPVMDERTKDRSTEEDAIGVRCNFVRGEYKDVERWCSRC